MLTITGEVEGAELAHDARPARGWVGAPLRRSARPVAGYTPPDARPPLAVLLQEPRFALMCPDSRGPSAIVDAQSFAIHYANRDGSALLRRNPSFRVEGGVLETTPPRAAERLRRALRSTQFGASSLVVIDSGYGAVAVRVSPLRPDHESSSWAIADFSSERLELGSDELAALAVGFGLTDAEAAVAGLMIDGLSLEAIAVVRGVRRETVRNQCKTILAKMHCHRQVDLVRMALSLCARVASPARFPSK